MIDYKKVAKRFGKVFVAAGIGCGAAYGLKDLTTNPWAIVFTPVVTALIAAIGNWLKHKLGLKVPF